MRITKKRIVIILLLIGFYIFSYGIYKLGFHNGLEKMRTIDSGLGGFAEWAVAMILIIAGTIIGIIGLIVKYYKRNST